MYSLSRRKLIKGIFPLSIYLSANRSDAVGLKNYPQYFNSDQFDKTKEELSALSYISKDKVAFLDVGLDLSTAELLIDNNTNTVWRCYGCTGTVLSWREDGDLCNFSLIICTDQTTFHIHPFSFKVFVQSFQEISSLPRLKNIIAEISLGPRKGVFKYYSGNFSEHIHQDRNRGIYIPPSNDKNAQFGCWVRDYGQKSVHSIDRSLYVNVNWFGADPTGVDSSSVAISCAFEVSNCVDFFGVYKFSGPPISSGSFSIRGNNSTICVDEKSVFIRSFKTIGTIFVENINLVGGLICFDFYYTSRCDFTVTRTFKNINFKNYTRMAIRLPNIDCPWWTIEGCVFIGKTSKSTIGLWNNSGDNNSIRFNKFYKNEVHISTSLPYSHNLIFNNDFGQFEEGFSPRANIWVRVSDLVPPFTGGTGVLAIENNKFGNENECEGDVKILFANVDGYLPDYINYKGSLNPCHVIFRNNFHLSRAERPANWMRTIGGWMPQSLLIELDNLQYSSFNKVGRYLCYMDNHNSQFYKISVRPLAYRDSDIIFRGAISNNINVSLDLINLSNTVLDGDPDTHSSFGSGIGLFTKDITKNFLPSFSSSKDIIYSQGVDSLGFTESLDIIFSSSESFIRQDLETISFAGPAWLEGELLLDADINSETLMEISYYSMAGSVKAHSSFKVLLKYQQWTAYSFPITAINSAEHFLVLRLDKYNNSPAKISWGRSRVYLSRSPSIVGNQKVGNLILSNVPSKPDGLPPGAIWLDKNGGNVLKIID